jgi:HK97 gp10 family phage protein
MVTGVNNLVNKLTDLTTSLDTKVYKIIKSNSQVIIDDAKQGVNVVTGNLRNSIGFIERNKRYKNNVIIGTRNYGGWNGKGYHAHLLEFGTKLRFIGEKTIRKGEVDKRAGYRGRLVPGKFAFMHQAFNNNKQAVGTGIITDLKKEISKQLKSK